MANLWVVITGLAVLVEMEGTSGKPHMVLLRQVAEGTLIPPQNGTEIPAHVPRVRLLPSAQEVLIGDRDVEFFPRSGGTPTIEDVDPFLRVGRELTDALKVQQAFVGPRASIAGWSRVVLPGPGEINPVHVKEEFDIKTVKLEVGLKLVGALDLELAAEKEKNKPNIANGLLYHRLIQDDKPVVHFSDGREYGLDAVDPSDVAHLPLPKPNTDPHYVVWAANSGRESGQGFDRDFYLLYDLLELPIPPRYVPLTKKKPGFRVKTPPGQCMIGYAFG